MVGHNMEATVFLADFLDGTCSLLPDCRFFLPPRHNFRLPCRPGGHKDIGGIRTDGEFRVTALIRNSRKQVEFSGNAGRDHFYHRDRTGHGDGSGSGHITLANHDRPDSNPGEDIFVFPGCRVCIQGD